MFILRERNQVRKLVYECYKKTILVEVAINSNAVIVVGSCVTVVAQNRSTFPGYGKMNFMQIEIIENKLCGIIRYVSSYCVKRRFCL